MTTAARDLPTAGCALASALALLLAAGEASGATAAPRCSGSAAYALVGAGARTGLVRVDPRSLLQCSGARAYHVGSSIQSSALSPDGRLVALALDDVVIVVDPAHRRIIERLREDALDASGGLLWPSRHLFIAVGASKFGFEYRIVQSALGTIDTTAAPLALLRKGLAIGDGGSGITIIGDLGLNDEEFDIALPQLPNASFAAADAARDRLFVLSGDGTTAAEIDGVRTRGGISYHRLAPPPAPLAGAKLAGPGRLVIWGSGGVALVDTRDWSTRTVTGVSTSGVAVAGNRLLAWNGNTTGGLLMFDTNGALRRRLLPGTIVRTVDTFGDYGYVSTDSGRYSLDLRTNLVTRLTGHARLIMPSADR